MYLSTEWDVKTSRRFPDLCERLCAPNEFGQSWRFRPPFERRKPFEVCVWSEALLRFTSALRRRMLLPVVLGPLGCVLSLCLWSLTRVSRLFMNKGFHSRHFELLFGFFRLTLNVQGCKAANIPAALSLPTLYQLPPHRFPSALIY